MAPARADDDPGRRWSVYFVACADGSFYCGISPDPEARTRSHNQGRGSRYTRARLPVRLVWSQVVGTHGDALRRERALKRLSRAGKMALIALGEPHRTRNG